LGGNPGVAGHHPRGELAHHVQRAAGVVGDKAQENIRGDPQRANRRLRAHGGATRRVGDDAHLALQLVAADGGHDELAGGRLADDLHFAFDDHIDTVRRLAAAHEVFTGIEPDGAAGERQELELRGIEAPEKGHLPQHFRFLEYIHFGAS
jgi:hypothetical protein